MKRDNPDAAPLERDSAAAVLDSRQGWAVVAAVFVLLAVNSGLGFYNLAVYLRVLSVQRDFPLSSTSAATAVFFLSSGIAGLFVARQIRLRDPRLSLAAGAFLGAASILVIGRAQVTWQLYAAYMVFGVAFTSAGLVPGTTIVTQWFRQNRSVALSVASTGLSVGGIVLTPASVALMERWGIERAAPVLAVGWLVGILPLTVLVIRPGPLSPKSTRAAGTRLALRGYSRHPFFVRMNLAYVLMFVAQVGVIAHLYNLGSERAGEAVGATMVSALALASVAARLVGGWILTTTSSIRMAAALVFNQAVAVAVLSLAADPLWLIAGAVLLGASVGNLLMLQSLLISEAFGERPYAGLFATSQLLTTTGYAAGAFFLGLLHSRMDGYRQPLVLLCAVSLVAATVLATAVLPVGEEQT